MRLTVQNASVAFGTRRVLENLELTIQSPMSVAVMGPSGSGKSTLLAVIAGMTQLDSGTAEFDASDEDRRSEWIVQNSPLLARRTALANVELGPLSAGKTADEAEALGRHWMSRLGIEELADERVFHLSGGERQRVAVARAISTGATVILADEPTASLDATAREKVCDALLEASAQGALVIVATHDAYVAGRCDRTFNLVDGRLAAA
jgi:ABC-type lipoprotein export system ATPase subunit